MRIRVGGVILLASVLACTASACRTAGVSFIYMAIDNAGQQPRNLFWTDSTAIYCIARVSTARQDATVDFRIVQKTIYDWCSGNSVAADHPTFAVGEIVPGVGVESTAALQILQTGIILTTMCPAGGTKIPNLPVGEICAGAPPPSSKAPRVDVCNQSGGSAYINEGPDTAGPGYTCCAPAFFVSNPATPTATIVAPYPPGTYSCIVSLDGEIQGQTDFSIEFPTATYPVQPPDPSAGATTGDGSGCPVPPPITGVSCYNWVKEGSHCPGFDLGSMCICDTDGLWHCP